MISILRRGKDTETRGKSPCNGNGRELCCHKLREARNARNHQKVEDAKNYTLERSWLCPHHDSDF